MAASDSAAGGTRRAVRRAEESSEAGWNRSPQAGWLAWFCAKVQLALGPQPGSFIPTACVLYFYGPMHNCKYLIFTARG